MVITDVNTGDVLALVSYPGYDNNKMANGVNAEYYSQLLNDQSTPLINYATRQMTAPGSTFKLVTATAGLMEGIINTNTTFPCNGVFDKIEPPPTCWINPGRHGSLNLAGGIRHSCNPFFYELAYRMGTVGDTYSPEAGVRKMEYYADLYGLTEPSGIEIEESLPEVSSMDPVRGAIGQDNSAYSTAGIARYITAVANSGTCYDLTLVDHITDHSGILLKEGGAKVRNTIDLDTAGWNAIHQGMRQVIEAKSYYNDLSINVAGKTGTAEENKNRANHALFVCYAPYENPEIAVVTRIAYGYTSNYAARTTKDVIQYYFDLVDEEELIKGTVDQMNVSTAVTD